MRRPAPSAARALGGLAGVACLLAALGAPACRGTTPAGTRAAYRRVQRAYEGAPPVVPHAVRALQRQDCLACHEHGLGLEDGGLAPTTPHPQQRLCQQCHVEQEARDDGLARNTFAGMRGPDRGTRAWAGAPPTIPHDVDGRRNCLGCHGALGGSPITTPHADRVNCPQCHVPQSPGITPWRANTFEGARP